MHIRLADGSGYKADVLYLCVDVQGSLHNVLYVVRNSVRNVDVSVECLMVDESLVSLRTEGTPHIGEVLGCGNYRVGLDVEVSGVIPSTDCKSGDMLQGCILGVGLVAHCVTVVEADVEGSLEGVVHIGASVPYTVSLVNLHMVHIHNQ